MARPLADFQGDAIYVDTNVLVGLAMPTLSTTFGRASSGCGRASPWAAVRSRTFCLAQHLDTWSNMCYLFHKTARQTR